MIKSLKHKIAHLPIIKEFLERKRVLKKVNEYQSTQENIEESSFANCELVLDRIALLNKFPKNAIVAEIGVDEGGFSESILEITKPFKLHLIDMWGSFKYPDSKHDKVKSKFADKIESGNVEINRGYSLDALKKFDNKYFDWVYLDSGHGYQITWDELMLLKDKVKDDGIISGHDYCRFTSDGRARFGVVEAVNKFIRTQGFELIYLTMETHRHLSFAIRKV